jgi:DNA-binding beta-propeller fold protein YncE
MALRLLGYIDLPAHRGAGGFDHADVYSPSDRLYVAHTSNDAIDVIDIARDQYIESMPGVTAVAGALVSEVRGLVFTSNRGENTVSVFSPHAERDAFKISVGVKPNGLAFDPVRGTLIAANVGDPSIPDSHSVSVVDLARRERIAEVGGMDEPEIKIIDVFICKLRKKLANASGGELGTINVEQAFPLLKRRRFQ